MRFIPVDCSALTFTVIGVQPRLDDFGTPQRDNSTGFPKFRLQCLVTTDAQDRAQLMDITVAQETEPVLAPLSTVVFERLVAVPWDRDGRFGVAFKADAVRLAGSMNGRSKVGASTAASPVES